MRIRPRASDLTLLLLPALVGLRAALPARPPQAAGPAALIDGLLAILLTAVILLYAAACGRALLRRLAPGIEREAATVWLTAAGFGLGALSLALLTLGLVGLFRPAALLGALWAAGWAGRGELGEALGLLRGLPGAALAAGRAIPPAGRAVWLVAAAVLTPALPLALGPAWAYDARMYHLHGPALFLEAGRITLLPELWQINGPSTAQLLYGLALALDSEPVAALLHGAFGLGVLAAGALLARRAAGPLAAALTPPVLLTLPAFPLWSGIAYADLAWAFYAALALVWLLEWTEGGAAVDLRVAGAAAGAAAGCKYLGLADVAALAALVAVAGRRQTLPEQARALARFVLPACIVGGTWYLKNLALAGNPVYPMLVGGPGWDAPRLELLMAYLRGFGPGDSLVEWLLLPVAAFFSPEAYRTLGPERLSPLLLVAAFYPLVGRRRALDLLGLAVLLRVLLWPVGSMQLRFLLPVCAPLAALAAHTLVEIERRVFGRRAGLRAAGALVTAGLAVTGVVGLALLVRLAPQRPALGLESRAAFLDRVTHDHRALTHAASELPQAARVLMLWDGQAYECGARCIGDADQSRAVRLFEGAPDPQTVARELQDQGLTHLLLSEGDARFMIRRDPSGRHAAALEYYRAVFEPACAREVFRDGPVQIAEIVCR